MAVALICNTWVLDQFFDQFCLKLQSNLVICCSAIWFGLTTKPDLCHWSPPYDPCRLSNKDCETKSTNFYGCIAFNCFSVHYQYMLHKLIQAAMALYRLFVLKIALNSNQPDAVKLETTDC